jgi:3'(2'), 5'-bisphosphate nucleotidase/myo-inositol-1(or 4)-monophosphatase
MSAAGLPLQGLCDVAIQAAREAGEFIQSVDRKTLRRSFKEGGSSAASRVVTEVDIRSEVIIRERLQAASREWDIAFVGEESASCSPHEIPERLRSPCFWSVDPLDGTLAYVEGNPGYAVSIALVDQSGTPLVGVVYDPVDSTLLHAIEGQGACRDLAPITGAGSGSASLLAFADSSFRTDLKHDEVVDALNRCARDLGLIGVDLVYGGGAVKNACQVLDHPSACYLKLPKPEDGGGSIWDFAASACIIREAGGWASNIHGQPLDLNRRDSTFMNHEGVLFASSEGIARHLIGML